MATTRRHTSLGSGKDKKPAKPFSRSNTYTYTAPASNKRSPKEATPASPSTSTSPTSNLNPRSPDKHVPNYLKPTLSSRSDTSTSSSRFLKKHDASFNRRKSFDRPPTIQHSLVPSSPKDKSSQLVSVRTTSFYPSTTTKAGSQSARAASNDKPSRAPLKSSRSVPGAQPAKTRRRSITSLASSNKGLAGKAPAKSSSKKAAPNPSAQAELDENEVLNLSNDIEEIASIGSDADLVPFDHIEKLEFYCASAATSGDVNACECDEPKKTRDMSTVLEDQLAPSPVTTRKEESVGKEGTSSELQQNDKVQEMNNQSTLADARDARTLKRDHDEDHQTEKADHERKNSDATKETVGSTEEGKIPEEKQKVVEDGDEGVKLAPVVVPVSEERKQVEEGEKEKGKKHSPVYNDVIKEAASKLLAKRKNKVSALVGAFETVISLQEPDSS